ncbi:stress responsive A B barrel domain protein [Fusarium subglutinans]|uniref:Stress responsive A B barrel domain protein n=1 Tax=Gibberella subglutinans TaxID=42677 RepID=A0A8H5V7M9_GIBSU|nr:stress responsive A B barrel domain protein [Fusarium subglutinans]KAF5611269.1 stress responsive A B barrel domain protein [Fusarium subglutinans]
MKPPHALSSLNTTQLSNSGIAYLDTALIVLLRAITRSYMNSRLVCRALTFSSSRIPTNPARISQHIKAVSRPFTQIPTVKMANRVHRITMFKLPSKDEQAKLLDQYHKLNASQQKDGKPYILSMVVGAADEDARSQGYTFVSKTEFASMEDMKYYDEGCQAHQALKDFVKGSLNPQGVMTVYFKPQAVGGADHSS